MARDRASRPEAKPLRLFVAIDLSEAALDLADRAEAPFRERHPRGRWVPRANRHVTVKFLGSTYPRLIAWVHETIAAVASAHEPIPTRLLGIGAFPNARRARVLWAGLDDREGAMALLAAGLDDALAKEFRPEKRAFTPHLTVARFDPPVPLEGLEEVELEGEPFVVDHVVLFRSHLRRPAPVYEPLETFPLGTRAAGG